MLPHDKLTLIRNRHRARELREFRRWVELYFERSEPDPDGVPADWAGAQEARAQLNRKLPRVLQLVRAAGIGGGGAPDPSATDPGPGLGRVDVLQRIFTARYGDGVDQEILDLLDMALGVYDSDLPLAALRTVNPLFYAGRILAFLGRGPRRFLRTLGFGARPRIPDARLAHLEALALRLEEAEHLVETRFAALQDRQARQQSEQARQLAELAERLDFVERVLTRPGEPGQLPPYRDSDHPTPV